MNLKARWNGFFDYVFEEPQNHACLIKCLAVVIGLFLFSRLPFFLYYPLPIEYPDTATYLWQLEKIEHGVLPTFELRTPGYPLFWWLCRMISHDILFVVYVQNAITFFTVILALFLLARYSPRFIVPATFALSVFISSPTHLAADMFLLTESIFANSILLFFIFLYMVLLTRKVTFALMASLSAASAIYIRANAIFLIPILFITALFLFNKYERRIIAGLVVPVAVALSLLVFYNGVTIRVFNLTSGGDWAMLWSTSIYVEPDPSLPDDINKAIISKSEKISKSDKDIIYHSWDLLAFQQTVERNIWNPIVPIVRITGGPGPDPYHYLKQRGLYRQIYQAAIRQHPQVYLKNFLGAFILYFMKVGTSDWGDFYSYFPFKQYWETFVERSFHAKSLKHYYNPKPPSEFNITISSGTKILMAKPRVLTRLYSLYAHIRALLFENMLWIIPLVLGLLLSVIGLIRSKGSSVGSLFILLMILCPLGHALLCSLTGHVEKRYTYSLEFINYLLFALAPLAFCRRLRS